MKGIWFMGLFSKLFSKNDNVQERVKVDVEVKTEMGNWQLDIPALQGDYAKTIFLWAHDKAAPIKKNEVLGKVNFYLNDKLISSTELISTESIKKKNTLNMFEYISNSWGNLLR